VEKLNQWLALLTNVGVLAGLILLIIEVEQNTTAIENQIDTALLESPMNFLIEDPGLAALHVRTESEPWDSFTPVERERLTALWALSLDSAELQFRMRQRGSEPLTADNIAFPQRLLSRDAFASFWRESADTGVLQPEFVAFFNSYLEARGN